MRFSSSRRSQSVIEYILILTAVSVVLITGILVKGGVFVKGVNAVLSLPGARIDAANSLMNFAAATAPATPACVCADPATFPCGEPTIDNCNNNCGTFGTMCGLGQTCIHNQCF